MHVVIDTVIGWLLDACGYVLTECQNARKGCEECRHDHQLKYVLNDLLLPNAFHLAASGVLQSIALKNNSEAVELAGGDKRAWELRLHVVLSSDEQIEVVASAPGFRLASGGDAKASHTLVELLQVQQYGPPPPHTKLIFSST